MSVDNYLGMYLEEDEALKKKLSGLTVPTQSNPSYPVGVWFRMPQQELRRRSFPHIMITPMGEQVAPERQHRGPIMLGYVPYTDEFYQYPAGAPGATPQATPPNTDAEFVLPWINTPPTVEFPIPIDLDYQVDVFTRYGPQLRQLTGTLNSMSLLHPRFAQLNCAGGTARRITVLSKQTDSYFDEESKEKRMFRLTYQLRINSEIMPEAVPGTRIQTIDLTLTPY
jgi:hypothetical protein